MTGSPARAPSQPAPPTPSHDHDRGCYDSGSDSPSSASSSSPAAHDAGIVTSPTRLLYNLCQLSDPNRAAMQDIFAEPPIIALQRCRRIGNVYAFQMTEQVTRSVRIRTAPQETLHAASRLSCSCGQAGGHPCCHVVWLLDQLLKETSYHHDHARPFNMTDEGFAEEMGDPFENIANFQLNVLAGGLHCQVVNSEACSDDEEEEELDQHRTLEARELLASVHGTPVDEYRPDIGYASALDAPVLKYGDLDSTVFRMLLDNHHFFQYFMSQSCLSDPGTHLYRKLYHRVDRVLHEFDASCCHTHPHEPSGHLGAEAPSNAAWAASHLRGIVSLIRSSIFHRDHPLRQHEARSAVSTLMHVLASVTRRHHHVESRLSRGECSLYMQLIGDSESDAAFVIAELDLLPESACRAVDDLGDILEQVVRQGAPVAFVRNLRNLIARLRASSDETGWKRHPDVESGRGSKRMK